MVLAPIAISNGLYYSIKEFANLTNRTEQSVRFLISKGNKMRKLKCEHFFKKPFIPAEELQEYPFTVSGRNNEEVYHYNKDGEIVK